MKFSTTLSLIIGSFFVAVQGQGITADIRYELLIEGVSHQFYGLDCNESTLYSNHPNYIEACEELEGYVIQAQTTGQPVGGLLASALDPSQPIQDPTACNVIGGKAILKIIFMEINYEVVGDPYISQLSSLIYTNVCALKMIAEQGKLSNFVPFFESNSLPWPPLSNNLS